MTAFEPTRRATLACVSGAFLSRSSTPLAALPDRRPRTGRTVCVLDHIPEPLHSAIRAGRCRIDLAPFFQAATVAANDGRATGEGPGGVVIVPAGVYPVSSVGIRDTVIVGEHREASRIVAQAGGTSERFLLDAMLDRDGVTSNTAGNGYACHLVIDAGGSGASGLRTYGGGCMPQDLTIASANVGLAAGLPMWSTFSNIHAVDCEIGFHSFALQRGDAGTSSTFINCWANRSKRYGFHITQLMYSAIINCAAQDSGTTNFFVEGDANGAAAAYSLQLIGCGSEGGGKPFYLRKCRDATLIGVRVVGPAADVDHITFDDSAGSIRDFSTVGPPKPPALSIRLVNHGAPPGGVLIDGSIVAIDPRAQSAFTLVGGSLNDRPGIQAPVVGVTGAGGTAAAQIETVGGAPAVTWRSGQVRLSASPLAGGTILSAGPEVGMATAVGRDEIALALSADRKALRLFFRDADGRAHSVDLPGRALG